MKKNTSLVTAKLVVFLAILFFSNAMYSQSITINPVGDANSSKTLTKLIEDVFIGGTCNGAISNVTSNTVDVSLVDATSSTIVSSGHKNFAYFTHSGVNFPIDKGIILSNGAATLNSGPNAHDPLSGTSSMGFTASGTADAQWGGDGDMKAILDNRFGDNKASQNATIVEFDFVPNGTTFSFKYLFASDEYIDPSSSIAGMGTNYECSTFQDGFAFILTSPTVPGEIPNDTGITGKNIALINIGGVEKEVSSGTIHNNTVMCNADVTPDGAAAYVDLSATAAAKAASPIEFNGRTKLLTASATVVAGRTYHMKMVISDRDDNGHDSSVFLLANSFDASCNATPSTTIDFDGSNDYLHRSSLVSAKASSSMMSWVKLKNGFDGGDIMGQKNYRIFIDGNDRLKAEATSNGGGPVTVTYRLDMRDSYGDGWLNSKGVSVTVNGVALNGGNAYGVPDSGNTNTPTTNTVTFTANVGDTIAITYTTDGFANEMSWDLVNVSDGVNVITNHTNNTNGASESLPDNTASCVSCPGGSTVVVTPNGSAPTLTEDLWCHVASIYNGATGEMKLYLNGELQDTRVGLSGNLSVDAGNFEIGRNAENSNNYFEGAIYESRVYDVALTEAQLREQIYQEVQNNGGKVHGSVIPKDIDGGSLNWVNLIAYYKMATVASGNTPDSSGGSANATLNNMTTTQVRTAPLPYVANASGNWTATGTWEHGNVWDVENLPNKDWAIVQVTNNSKVTTTASHTHLGTIVDSGSELSIENDQLLTTTSYLKLDGHLDLVGESQLIQTVGSTFEAASTGYLERDQQGKSTIYSYNFWSSPVYPTVDGVNNADYSITEILKSDILSSDLSKNIKFIAVGYDGSTAGTTVTLADYWMFRFVNQPDVYGNWFSGHVRSTGDIKVGQGYTMKGGGSAMQNYVFTGKPNNGVIQHAIGANHVYLVGNPYSSALDANKFINDNIASVEDDGDIIGNGTTRGALYFWEHFTGNSSHVFAEYQGGYATYNLIGGVVANPDVDVSSNGTGTIRPGQYVPVGQGFFIEGSPSGGTFEFNNSQRVFKKEVASSPGAGVDYSIFAKTAVPEGVSQSELGINEGTSVSDVQRVYFKFTRPEGSQRELLLGVKSGLADGINYGYDARLLENLSSDCGWLLKTAEEDEKLVIQGIGSIYDNLELPLHIKASEDGVCKFEAGSFADLDPSTEVYFLDKELGTRIRLEAGVAIGFNLAAGVYSDRFYVVFKERKEAILIVEDSEETEEVLVEDSEDAEEILNDLVVFYNGNTKNIEISNPSEFTAKNITVYAVTGQEVVRVNSVFTEVSKVELPVNIASGVYLVRFDYNNGTAITKKLIIK